MWIASSDGQACQEPATVLAGARIDLSTKGVRVPHADHYTMRPIKTRTEYVNVKKAADVMGQDKCTGLLGLHAFTGCELLLEKGKVSALRLLASDRHRDTLKCL